MMLCNLELRSHRSIVILRRWSRYQKAGWDRVSPASHSPLIHIDPHGISSAGGLGLAMKKGMLHRLRDMLWFEQAKELESFLAKSAAAPWRLTALHQPPQPDPKEELIVLSICNTEKGGVAWLLPDAKDGVRRDNLGHCGPSGSWSLPFESRERDSAGCIRGRRRVEQGRCRFFGAVLGRHRTIWGLYEAVRAIVIVVVVVIIIIIWYTNIPHICKQDTHTYCITVYYNII
jgi:hypothetical protein